MRFSKYVKNAIKLNLHNNVGIIKFLFGTLHMYMKAFCHSCDFQYALPLKTPKYLVSKFNTHKFILCFKS